MGKEPNKSRLGARRKAFNDYPKVKTIKDLHNKPKNEEKNKTKSNMADDNMDTGNAGEMSEQNLIANKAMNSTKNSNENWNSKNNLEDDENDCDNKKGKENHENTNNKENLNGAGFGKVYAVYETYLESDMGPYFVHLATNSSRNETEEETCDLSVGLKLKRWKVKGIRLVKKISRREIKITFEDRNSANAFIKSNYPKELKLKAYIPKYNVEKTGIIFDINTSYDDEQIMKNLESNAPIVNVYRCLKKKVVNGRKTKDLIPSNTIKIVFRCQTLPDEVSFGYSKRKVKPFVPNVTQCYKCLRFGHISKVCKQTEKTCNHCGTQHSTDTNDPCQGTMKCFHCHSKEHNSFHKECPEFLRNQLIKETMVFKNMTFHEANEEFPRTTSCYRIAEKQSEFPELPNRRKERNEQSYPRKNAQDLAKQYNEYLLLNQGKKPAYTSGTDTAPSYSNVARSQTSTNVIETPKSMHSNPKTANIADTCSRTQKHGRALEFINELSQMLQKAHTDPDQTNNGELSNDVLLINLSRMIFDFMQNFDREIISYSDLGARNSSNC